MKSLIEEYGKIIFLVLSVSVLLVFTISRSDGGFLYILQNTKELQPIATVGTKYNAETLDLYSQYAAPELKVVTERLIADKEYDLLYYVKDKETFTEKYDLSVIKITDPDGEVMPLPTLEDGKMMYSFPGLEETAADEMNLVSYQVTYELTFYYEISEGKEYPVISTATYQFVVD